MVFAFVWNHNHDQIRLWMKKPIATVENDDFPTYEALKVRTSGLVLSGDDVNFIHTV